MAKLIIPTYDLPNNDSRRLSEALLLHNYLSIGYSLLAVLIKPSFLVSCWSDLQVSALALIQFFQVPITNPLYLKNDIILFHDTDPISNFCTIIIPHRICPSRLIRGRSLLG